MDPSQPARAKEPEAANEAKTGKLSKKILLWVGYATAIISLIAGARQLSKVVLDRIDTDKKVNALLADEAVELGGKDYQSAWHSVEQASAVDSKSAKVKAAQEALAVEWLDNVRSTRGENVSDIARKLEPVLTRGIATSQVSSYRAHLLAHLGWCYALEAEFGTSGPDPAPFYAQAIKEDEHNPYAQAMWGHWILSTGGSLSDATAHFNSALVSSRARDFVRDLQLSALLNRQDAFDEEVIRVANQVRKDNGTIAEGVRRSIWGIYYFRVYHTTPATKKFIEAVPPGEHLSTFLWLFPDMKLNESDQIFRMYYQGVLQEAAGNPDEARKSYLSVVSQGRPQQGGIFAEAAQGLKRVTPRKP